MDLDFQKILFFLGKHETNLTLSDALSLYFFQEKVMICFLLYLIICNFFFHGNASQKTRAICD
jgi:hypothetical protein